MALTRLLSCFFALAVALPLASPVVAAPFVSSAFEENRGQLPEDVRYAARGGGYGLLASPQGLRLRARRGAAVTEIVLRFAGGADTPELRGERPLEGVVHYYRGNDPSRWATGVARFGRLRYAGVYDGIDAVVHDRGGALELDFEVAPGADPGDVALAFAGSDAVSVDSGGRLLVRAGDESFALSAPVLYQQQGEQRLPIDGRYRVVGPDRVAFEVGAYDPARPLVIDPVLLGYSTRLGGSGADTVRDVAVDPAGSVYLTGYTNSADFEGGPGAAVGDDVFVAKLAPNGKAFLYVAFLSGSGTDQAWSVDTDATGNAYVGGQTNSANFPVPNGFDTTVDQVDAFAVKLDPAGNLLYGTFFGGASDDGQFDGGVAADASGRLWIASRADTTNLPTLNPFSTNCPNAPCAFAAGFDPALSGPGSLVYASYVTGANNMDEDNGALDFDVDSSGNLYVFGFTNPDSTLVQAGQGFQDATGDVNNNDHFLVVLDPSLVAAAQRVYSTFIGGLDDEDERGGIEADDAGIVHVASRTFSNVPVFPVKNPFQATNAGSSDVYVQKIDTTLSGAASQIWGTFLGAAQEDEGGAVTVDSSGNVWVALLSSSPGFPLVLPLMDAGLPSMSARGVVSQLSSDGQTLLFSSPVSAGQIPGRQSIKAGPGDRIFATGSRPDADFQLLGGLPLSPIGSTEIALIGFDPIPDRGLVLEVTDSVDPAATGDTFAYRYLVKNEGVVDSNDIELTTDFPVGLSAVLTSANCTFPGVQSVCDFFETLPRLANEPVYLLASAASAGSYTVNASVTSAEVDPTPGDAMDSETIGVTLAGSPAASLTLSDFDAVANSQDIGAFSLDTADGVLATPNGSFEDAVNLMVFDGQISFRIAELLGQGEVAFGLVERATWTPSNSDGGDLFGRQFNALADRVFAIVDAKGGVELRTARDFSQGRVIAIGQIDLGRGEELSFVLDTVTPNAQVLYDGFVVAEGNPFTMDPDDALPANVGDDFVISVGFGTEFRGAATFALPEPGELAMLCCGALALLALGRRRIRA